MPKAPGRLTAVLYRYRTEGGTPLRQALAIGLGLYIGASPFIGLHLALALGLGWLFGLNRFKVYLAANISNPFVAPLIYAIEIQVGTWFRTGRLYSIDTIRDVRLQGLGVDLLVGSVIVGAALAVAGACLTYWSVRRRAGDPEIQALLAAAAERYLVSGVGSWELARSKLRMDPVYLQVLRDGRLPSSGVLIDLGCGQGLMLALLATARHRGKRGLWPASWPPPPVNLQLRGIETRSRVARLARQALEEEATIDESDLSRSTLQPCDAVLLFDVLHLLSRETQDVLLATAARVMPSRSVLMIREADAEAGWKFNMVRAGNRLNAILQGQGRRRFCFDGVKGWTSRLSALGFEVESVTRHDAGPFANVLLQARLVKAPTPEKGVLLGIARTARPE